MKKLLIMLTILCVFALYGCTDSGVKKENEPVQTLSESTQKNNKENKSGENAIKPSEDSGEKASSEQKAQEPNAEEQKNEEQDKVEKDDKKEESNSGYTIIKFSDMYETKGKNKNVSTMLKNLNGKKVQIKGYPAVQSPLDESFVYLNNQPYVTCPFCTIGDTTKLEVIPILMANKSKIKYTENALVVYGTLEIAAKVDSEGYTTQFRVYADKVEELKDDNANKAVNSYYQTLSQEGMIYDIQTLQMNIEYATNPEYMVYYDEALQTGKSTSLSKENAINGIVAEYSDFDDRYGGYLRYIKECPDIVKMCEPQDERLKKLNDELIALYNKQIEVLEKYQNIVYEYVAIENPSNSDVEKAYKALTALNGDNLKLYDEFTAWNNKLRE